MKAAFYFSAQQYQQSKKSNIDSTLCQIDGREYSELNTFEDHEEIVPWGRWDDYQLITVVENVNVSKHNSLQYDGPLSGRIKINGKPI